VSERGEDGRRGRREEGKRGGREEGKKIIDCCPYFISML